MSGQLGKEGLRLRKVLPSERDCICRLSIALFDANVLGIVERVVTQEIASRLDCKMVQV